MSASNTDLVQGSPEWHAMRCGKVTASRVADLIARTKTGWGASRANYLAELVAERLTGASGEQFVNAAMKWGIETEAQARDAYAFYADTDVEQVAFVNHPRIHMSGASPDGLVGADGLVEFKCPNTATHIDTLLGDAIPSKYLTQMQWQMACTGRAWCDWASYDPRLPEAMRLFVHRVKRDEAVITDLEKSVTDFLAEVDIKVAALTRKFPRSVAA